MLLPEEAAEQHAAAAEQQATAAEREAAWENSEADAQRLAERLRELGIDPEAA